MVYCENKLLKIPLWGYSIEEKSMKTFELIKSDEVFNKFDKLDAMG